MKQSGKAHNPTPEERDERFSLYGLDPVTVIETVLQTKSEEAPKTKTDKKSLRKRIRPKP